MTDSELIRGLLEHNGETFRCLVEQYQKLVYNVCFNLLRQREDAEDVAQDVFIEIFESIHLFRNESKLSTWLYRIAINKSLNYLRKNKWKSMVNSFESFFTGDKNLRLDVEDPDALDTPDSIDYTERASILGKAIGSLPENQRIAFSLSKYDDLSYQEIAEIMNLSLSSIESLIHRAKMGLQKKLISYYKNN
jgi:RNA polymerase sigma-70 factor (ECF subfamily)